MKAIFGILSLVIVLALVDGIARKQLQGVGGSGSVATRQGEAMREAARQAGLPAPAVDSSPTVPQVSKSLQDQARDRTVQALQQGVQRTEGAAP